MENIIKRFCRKPVVMIEAVQYDGNNGTTIKQWSHGSVVESPVLEPTEDNPTGDICRSIRWTA